MKCEICLYCRPIIAIGNLDQGVVACYTDGVAHNLSPPPSLRLLHEKTASSEGLMTGGTSGGVSHCRRASPFIIEFFQDMIFRTRFKKQIVSEFLPPARPSKKVIVLAYGMPGVPKAREVMEFWSKKG